MPASPAFWERRDGLRAVSRAAFSGPLLGASVRDEVKELSQFRNPADATNFSYRRQTPFTIRDFSLVQRLLLQSINPFMADCGLCCCSDLPMWNQ